MSNIKLWFIYCAITLLAACGAQESANSYKNTDAADVNIASLATNNVADNAAPAESGSDSKLLTSLAATYPGGQLPAERAAQAAQELSQNPTALLLTSAAPSATNSSIQQQNGFTLQPQAISADYQPVQRVQNTTLYGAYFFSIYPSEITTALATNPSWRLEGPAFWASLATGTDLHPVHRFQNKLNGSYLYSIYETERADIAANYAATFEYEGVAWHARQTTAIGWSALYRFRNKTNGTYLFSAYESEKDAIVATYPDVFALEGIAYYVRQDAPVDPVVPPVVPPVITPTITSIAPSSPTTVTLGIATPFTVIGTNLPFTAILSIAGAVCQVSTGNTATGFSQICTLGGTPGAKAIAVSSANGGIVLDATRTVTAVSPPSKLPDTGITSSQCYRAGTSELSTCALRPLTGTAYILNSQQDGMEGLDVTAPAAADGKLGFSYSEVPNPAGGDFPKTDCIKDNITGLTWEGKTASGVRTSTRTYTNLGDKISSDAAGYIVNAQGLCGYGDWRLPTADELQSIVDYGAASPGPRVDTAWFLNATNSVFWSSSPYLAISGDAWTVNFNTGLIRNDALSSAYSVRLVRSDISNTSPGLRYVPSANGQEVTDSKTGLIWRRCAEGKSWTGSTCAGTNDVYGHESALARATSQTLATNVTWRLPNVKELASIADKTLQAPAIDSAIFPVTSPSSFWSSSPYVGTASEAWGVSFNDGYVFSVSRTNNLYIRLVRTSP